MKMTQAHFNKTLNDLRSQLHRAGLAQAHVEEMCCLILMEIAIDCTEGSRTKASKYLVDLGYKLGARIRDPGRTDVAKGNFKPSWWDRAKRAVQRNGGEIAQLKAEVQGDKYEAEVIPMSQRASEPRPLVESKPRIILPPSGGRPR